MPAFAGRRLLATLVLSLVASAAHAQNPRNETPAKFTPATATVSGGNATATITFSINFDEPHRHNQEFRDHQNRTPIVTRQPTDDRSGESRRRMRRHDISVPIRTTFQRATARNITCRSCAGTKA